MAETISFDVRVLVERLKRHKSFRIRLPHTKAIYIPDYRPQSLYIPGDVVVFSFDMKGIMVGIVAERNTSGGIVYYDVDCVHRQHLPSNADGFCNTINKIKIIRKDIICELIPEQK
jgi:hypothetical protein